MTNLPRANDDSAARLLLAEHAEERGDGRMARAWQWMACMAKWPELQFGWWPDRFTDYEECHRLPIEEHGNDDVYGVTLRHDCEQAIADALEKGDL